MLIVLYFTTYSCHCNILTATAKTASSLCEDLPHTYLLLAEFIFECIDFILNSRAECFSKVRRRTDNCEQLH